METQQKFLQRVLDPPAYGFEREGKLYIPTLKELLSVFISRLNIFKNKKNWVQFSCWLESSLLAIPFCIYLFYYFSWPLTIIALFYSMVLLGSHGTIYLHRYSTHRGYQFSGPIWKFIAKNLVLKIVPEELYVVSHHVHHAYSDEPGDPYNANAGWWYCFLADANHQPIRKDMTREEYAKAVKLMEPSGVRCNSYEKYLIWGSLAKPLNHFLAVTLNWAFWYGVFYLVGGNALATAIFGVSVIWAFGVRTFNYDGHGHGKDKRRKGIDFNWQDRSINQLWPGYVAGEWHNNHHLYPNAARAGFLPHQIDTAWIFIKFYSLIGGVKSYNDPKKAFYKDHYLPYLASKKKTNAA